MEMQKQTMNCALPAVQGEELLRECTAFECSCAVDVGVFLETRQ